MGSKSEEFLTELKNRIAHLPATEVLRVLSYYSESLEDKLEDGFTEEQAIKSFGSIDEIVKNVEEEVPITLVMKDKVKTKSRGNGVNKALIAIIVVLTFPFWIGILAGAFGIVVGVYAVLWTVPIIIGSLYFSLYPIAICGVFYGFVRMFTLSVPTGLAYLGVGIISAGLAIMFFYPLLEGAKLWLKVNVWPFKKIKQWLIRKA